jgi:general stress protein 26
MDTRQSVLQFLKSRNLMTLATSAGDQSWCSVVYYAVGNDLSLYFMSNSQSRHAKNLELNQNASIAIADSGQSMVSKKVGAQLEGQVEIVKELSDGQADEHFHGLNLWLTAIGGFEKNEVSELASTRAMIGTLYKFTPRLIRYLNEAEYGDYAFQTLVLADLQLPNQAPVPKPLYN